MARRRGGQIKKLGFFLFLWVGHSTTERRRRSRSSAQEKDADTSTAASSKPNRRWCPATRSQQHNVTTESRKRPRERPDPFHRSPRRQQPPTHGRARRDYGAGRDERRTREGEPEQGQQGPRERTRHHDHRAPQKEKSTSGDGVRHSDRACCTGGTQGFEVVCRSATAVGSGRQDGERQGAEEAQAQQESRSSRSGRGYLPPETGIWPMASSPPTPAPQQSTRRREAHWAWHTLPTPLLFELADMPYPLLAQVSGADVSTLVEKELKCKRPNCGAPTSATKATARLCGPARARRTW